MEQFKIKTYTKQELTLLYFPDTQNVHTAVCHDAEEAGFFRKIKKKCGKVSESQQKSAKVRLPPPRIVSL